jgi:hypothetical protein
MTEQHVEGSVRAGDLGSRRLSLPVGNMKRASALVRGLTRPGTMGRTSLKHTSATGRRLGLSLMRRRPWKPNNVNITGEGSSIATRPRTASFVAGEFEKDRHGFAQMCRRGPGLVSDIFLLILASPFFAVWWGFRLARRVLNKDR